MMIVPNSFVRQKEEPRGKRGSKKERSDRNSDARRGRSNISNSVRDVGCKEQEKTWTVVWDFITQEGQRGLGIYPILSRKQC